MVQHVGPVIGYVRVSSAGQNLDRQLAAIGDVDQLFEEKVSAASRVRPALEEMLRFARKGDRVVVASMDRLARSVVDLNQIVQTLIDKGVTVEFLKENLTFAQDRAQPFAEFQLNIMAAFAQLERAITRERQAEGIAAAKKRGVYKGRARALTDQQLAQAKEQVDQGVPKAVIARRLGVHRTTLYRRLKEMT